VVKRFFDVLLGRARPVNAKMDRLFAMSTAYVTLTAELGLTPGGRSGICFRSPASAAFDRLRPEMDRLLEISSSATGTKVEQSEDAYGFQWIVLNDDHFEDLVATTHIFSSTLEEEGFGEQLLAAVFRFLEGDRPVYWIYNYKRGAFYPFVPRPGEGRKRDNAYELRLRAAMERELPIEQDVDRWYPLWGVPL
jgi:hypothetical protein